MENFKKITKPTARKIFNNGGKVWLKANNLRMDWAVEIDPDWENNFDATVNAYAWYNCNRECGMRVQYFVKEVA